MGCQHVRVDNPRALVSGLSYVQVDKHGITILCHLYQCRPCAPVICIHLPSPPPPTGIAGEWQGSIITF